MTTAVPNVIEPTGVNVAVLKKDAAVLGIENLDELNIYRLARVCDQRMCELAVDQTADVEDRRDVTALVRQVFVWGLFYLTKTADNPKSVIALRIIEEAEHEPRNYYEVATQYETLLQLFK